MEALRESTNKLFGGEASDYSNLTLAIVVTLIAIVISAFPLAKIWRAKEKGAAARAQLVESINDEVSLLAALAGILLVANSVFAADGIASLMAAGVIAVNASSLWRANAQDLMGRSPEEKSTLRSRTLPDRWKECWTCTICAPRCLGAKSTSKCTSA